jgi:hypothetical protein
MPLVALIAFGSFLELLLLQPPLKDAWWRTSLTWAIGSGQLAQPLAKEWFHSVSLPWPLHDCHRKRGSRLPGEDDFMRLADMEDFVQQAEREAMQGDDDDDDEGVDAGTGENSMRQRLCRNGLCDYEASKGSACLADAHIACNLGPAKARAWKQSVHVGPDEDGSEDDGPGLFDGTEDAEDESDAELAAVLDNAAGLVGRKRQRTNPATVAGGFEWHLQGSRVL